MIVTGQFHELGAGNAVGDVAPSSSSQTLSPFGWMTSAGTAIAGNTFRTSMFRFIMFRVRTVPGLALVSTHFRHHSRIRGSSAMLGDRPCRYRSSQSSEPIGGVLLAMWASHSSPVIAHG